MERSSYAPEYKAKLVLEVLQDERVLCEIESENHINPNVLRNWKKEFMKNTSRIFDESRQAKETWKREEDLRKQQDQMLKTIGQWTLNEAFLRTASLCR